VVGLYLDSPERALVLSLDEKSQIQALDRTQPGLRGREQEEAQREFNWVASVLDLLLEPDTAEEAIGDLAELYVRRRAVNPRPCEAVVDRAVPLDRLRPRHGRVRPLHAGARGEVKGLRPRWLP
jgi:hypothetical protein